MDTRGGHCFGKAIGLAAVCLALSFALSPAFARKGSSDVVTASATVVSIALHSAESCADYGVIRWQAVKGVDSYTVLFNDAAFGGAEQTVTVGEPFEDDHREPAGSPVNAPAGSHQLNWTGLFGSPPCGEPTDYSGRLTNARVQYVREGTYIDGTISAPKDCGSACSVQGVKVTAKGESTKSDTTDASGDFSIKVPKGSYTVVPKKGQLEFTPSGRDVRVGASRSARANFSIRSVPPAPPEDPLAVATISQLRARPGHKPTAVLIRDGVLGKLGPETQLRVGDRIQTDRFTTAAFEFAIGGRVGVAENSGVEITSESDSNNPTRVKLTQGELHAKAARHFGEELEIEIQTGGGGVIGIRG